MKENIWILSEPKSHLSVYFAFGACLCLCLNVCIAHWAKQLLFNRYKQNIWMSFFATRTVSSTFASQVEKWFSVCSHTCHFRSSFSVCAFVFVFVSIEYACTIFIFVCAYLLFSILVLHSFPLLYLHNTWQWIRCGICFRHFPLFRLNPTENRKINLNTHAITMQKSTESLNIIQNLSLVLWIKWFLWGFSKWALSLSPHCSLWA